MGHGRWDDDAYYAAAAFRAANGEDAFGYTRQVTGRERSQWRAAEALDPLGVDMRESRDSAEHPGSTPIVVLFDVTGSMGRVPRVLQAELPALHGLLIETGAAPDAQIMFGGVGDAESDMVPLQIGQFESDNRMDDQLRQIFLEGGGGGQKSESYELAAYFVNKHITTDAWERRAEPGHLFVIGDEMNKPVLSAAHIRQVIGDRVTRDLSVGEIYRELHQRWHITYVMPGGSSYYTDREVERHWRRLVGPGFVRLPDPADICRLIAERVAGARAATPTIRSLGRRIFALPAGR